MIRNATTLLRYYVIKPNKVLLTLLTLPAPSCDFGLINSEVALL